MQALVACPRPTSAGPAAIQIPVTFAAACGNYVFNYFLMFPIIEVRSYIIVTVFITAWRYNFQMTRRKKWLISLSIAAVVLVSGGWYAKIYVTNRIFDSIESALKDPEIQKPLAELDAKEIDQLIDSVDTDKLIAEAGGSEALPSIAIPDLTVSPDTGKAGTDSSQASAAPTTKPSTSSTPAATAKPGAASTATPKPGVQPDATATPPPSPSTNTVFLPNINK